MYINIAKRIANILISPQQEWNAVAHEDSDQTEVLTKFVLPLLGIGAGLVFLRQLWLPQFSVTSALRLSSLSFGTMLLGVYAVFWVNQKLLGNKLAETSQNQWFSFAAYTSGIYCIAETLAMMFPHLFILRAAALLSAFAAWHWAIQKTAGNTKVSLILAANTAIALVAAAILWSFIATWLQNPSN